MITQEERCGHMQVERNQLSVELESRSQQHIALTADLREAQRVNKEFQDYAAAQQHAMAEMHTSQCKLEQALQTTQVSCPSGLPTLPHHSALLPSSCIFVCEM